ncbi:MFS transporter [Isoptericola sp. BMS4]|uniref:MFS transporter n=1 Tax=Isoptericola sp. BMS4 TaxID=2527875 RepID=UPI00142306CB|nr:MFS transporter [Isoptericola sp. BMS4]
MPTDARRDRPARSEAPQRGARTVVAVACLAFFLITLDVNVVNVALPTIAGRLGVDAAGLPWIVDAYAVLFAGLLLTAGAVVDRAGASRAMAVGMAGFVAASAACGLAPSGGALIAARVVQGCAAALMLPASLSLVRRAYPDPVRRGRGVALWTAAGGAAAAAGPVAGGVLTATLGWRAVFFVNVPLGVAALAGLRAAPRTPGRPAPLDLPGQVTAVVALCALVAAVIEGGAHGVTAPVTLLCAAVAVCAGAAFVAAELRSPHPAVPPRLVLARGIAVPTVIGFALNLVFYGVVFVLTLGFQVERGASALVTGLMFLPMTGLVTGVNVLGGRLGARFGPRMPLVVGQVVLASGLVALLVTGAGSSTALLLLATVPVGVGAGLAVPALTSAVLDAVPAERSGLAGGILSSARQVGSAMGVAVFGALVAGPAGFSSGMRLALVAGVLLLVVTTTGTATLPRAARSGPVTHRVPASSA